MAMPVIAVDKMDVHYVRLYLSVLIIHWRSMLRLAIRHTAVVFWWPQHFTVLVVEIAMRALLLTVANNGDGIGHKDG